MGTKARRYFGLEHQCQWLKGLTVPSNEMEEQLIRVALACRSGEKY